MQSPDDEVTAVQDPLTGRILGKDYRVLERIGTGGMGVVYLVEHVALRKRFAAKVLSAELAASDEARARFQSEAHAASQLEHENIVSVTDYGVSSDGRPYIVMEFLRGRTLDHRLQDGPLTLEEIVAVVVPVARALAEAHAEGIVHRDVKPENVFLTQRSGGRWGVKVLDFGIAKSPVGRNRLTKMGQALGSPMYMAPEACRGEEVDHRADIYSVGVLMYLLWCGRVPFEDDNLLKVLQMQVSEPLTPPSYWRPDLSPRIEAVILRALEKDADRRYLSIAELLSAFEGALPPGADRLLLEAARGTRGMSVIGDLPSTPFPDAGSLRNRTDPDAIAPTRPVLTPVPTPPATTPPATTAPVEPRPRARWMVPAVLLLIVAGLGGAYLLKRSKASAGDRATPATAGSGSTGSGSTGSSVAGPTPTPAPPPAPIAEPAVLIDAAPPPIVDAAPAAVVDAAPTPTGPARPPRTGNRPRVRPGPTGSGTPASGSGSGSGNGNGSGSGLGIRTNR